jgi:hypothetical protein
VTLPSPETVLSDARADAGDTGASANLALSGSIDRGEVERESGRYVGETAGELGRLAAGLESAGRLHYPEVDVTADGPWLVLAPLSGVVSTVATGSGRATVTLDYDAAADPALDGLDQRVSALLHAARPTHEHYPVETDTRGVFTTGMTTFALDSIEVDDQLTATFDVSTTPATDHGEIESRFDSVQAVDDVEYESTVGVDRAEPSVRLQSAVESAHRQVYGDCEYEWLPGPGVFTEIPGREKVALGPGVPGATEFSEEQYQSCLAVLQSLLSNLEASA